MQQFLKRLTLAKKPPVGSSPDTRFDRFLSQLFYTLNNALCCSMKPRLELLHPNAAPDFQLSQVHQQNQFHFVTTVVYSGLVVMWTSAAAPLFFFSY